MKRLTISERFYLKDEKEILSYIGRNRPCSVFDIELCCHQEKKPVLRHLVNLRRQGAVSVLRGKWQISDKYLAVRAAARRKHRAEYTDFNRARNRYVKNNIILASSDPESLFFNRGVAHAVRQSSQA